MLIPVSRAIRKAIKALYLFLNIQTHTSSTSAVKTAVLHRGESSQSQLFLRYFARILLDYPNLTSPNLGRTFVICDTCYFHPQAPFSVEAKYGFFGGMKRFFALERPDFVRLK